MNSSRRKHSLNQTAERPSLEYNFYEILDQKNVEIIDLSAKGGNEIAGFAETGIKTNDGKLHEVDVIASKINRLCCFSICNP